MEYVSGHSLGVTSLRDWLEWRANVNFPPDMETAAGIRFVFEAVKGLAYAKKQVNGNLGIPFIHKDIKPENLDNKNLVFGCAGRVGIFDSTFPSIIEGNGKSRLKKMSRTA